MTYQTPDLLLVGAAKNLVLGTNPKSSTTLNSDPGNDAYTSELGLGQDAGSW